MKLLVTKSKFKVLTKNESKKIVGGGGKITGEVVENNLGGLYKSGEILEYLG